MPTLRSQFSFEQFEQVLQKLAHKIAIDAVTNLRGEVRIVVHGGRLSHVETDKYSISFYAKHISYHEEDIRFDVEKKIYLTSNHRTKISFEVWPKERSQEFQERIIKFIEKIMAEAGIKPVPRFKLSKMHGSQRYLDLMKSHE